MRNLDLPDSAPDTQLRERALLVQPDATQDHGNAVTEGVALYAEVTSTEDREYDHLLAGQISRGVAYHSELADRPVEVVSTWMRLSLHEFRNSGSEPMDAQSQREISASYTTQARIEYHQIRMRKIAVLATHIRYGFEQSDGRLVKQHKFGSRWPRYGAENALHWAVFEGDETVNGTWADRAVAMAAIGMWRAVRAEREASRSDHRAFVRRQVGANALAGMVAVTRPVAAVPGIRSARQKVRAKLLD